MPDRELETTLAISIMKCWRMSVEGGQKPT